ncbi:hypothetical protein LCGC14_2191750 [marine sediment metagenome]|uniref:YopX protein domain-containing protein n=1 Tax=marine sediment metagenome TaxID=412755 RepID=A0A0F9GF85_9ZZZZ
MRPYRAIPIDGKDFVYGWYIELGNHHLIADETTDWDNAGDPGVIEIEGLIEVNPKSIGQATGLKAGKKEIYGGDIVKLSYGIPPTYDTLIIEYADNETIADISVSGWWMRNTRKNGCSSSLCKTYEHDIEIIGTIHTHPELIKK